MVIIGNLNFRKNVAVLKKNNSLRHNQHPQCYFQTRRSKVKEFLEVILIAAAVDGVIDKHEEEAIMRLLVTNSKLPRISKDQVRKVKSDLASRFASGLTPEEVIKSASNVLDGQGKLLALTLSLEVVMSNQEISVPEAAYLNELCKLFEVDAELFEKLTTSASLRYGLSYPRLEI